jgi:antirestriction protein
MTSIFIQSLADYNAGRIVGKWVDVSGMDTSSLWDAINQVLAMSSEENPEEWEIADYDGFYGLSPTSLERVIEVAEAINHHGEPYAIYARYVGEKYATESGFEDSYQGAWDSFLEFATDLFDECYLHDIPENIRFYVDYEQFARDLEMDYHHDRASDGKIHIFSCY